MAAARISAAQLRRLLESTSEWALLDVREEGIFSNGHLLFAISVPLSRLELLIADFVPRRGTALIVCGGTGLAEKAATRLARLGYANVKVLPGEVAAWRKAGLEIYTGVFVPSKAFGEVVEKRCGTPHMAPQEVKSRIDAGEDVVILDSRPLDEYRGRCIPGAIDVPGVELVYHIQDLMKSPSTLVVVNCGGRTRSIIGAQSLINAGVRNRVVALKDGTMGWHLAGFELEFGQSRRPRPVSPAALRWARATAQRMARRYGVRFIDHSKLKQWSADTRRTLYVFDVRQPEEFALGHLPGSRHVQGGQLVQETDRNIAVRNSRVVLVDDTGARATVAASWLRQMGHKDVYVLRDALSGMTLQTGPWRTNVLAVFERPCDEISAHELLQSFPGDRTIIDFSYSTAYRRGHIPGSHFAIRAQLREALANMSLGKSLVITSEDGVLARLAAPEVAQASGLPVRALVGGNEAWLAAGGKMESSGERWAVPPQDLWLKPFDQLQGKVEDRLKSYLSWEVGLLQQLERDSGVRFSIPRA
jgi:rhodanese-related sulfurtransferase